MSNIESMSMVEMFNRVNKLKGEGKEIISFLMGEPQYKFCDVIRMSAKEALENAITGYTPITGMNELKDEIIHKIRKEDGVDYLRENIVVCNGAKHCLYNIMQIIINRNDEVIIPRPYWTSYPQFVKFAKGIPVFVDTEFEEKFSISIKKILDKITKKTKAIIINNPNNP